MLTLIDVKFPPSVDCFLACLVLPDILQKADVIRRLVFLLFLSIIK